MLGGQSAKSNDLTGYNYLSAGNRFGGAATVNAAQTAGVAGSQGAQSVQDQEAQLLGTKPITGQTKTAFNNYLGSTGYNFQMDQGSRAITGSAAAKGLLGSGATAKALTSYGQGLSSSYFNNYLGQLGSLNNQNTATAGQGITAANDVAQAGTEGGKEAGNDMQTGITGAFGKAAGLAAMFL